MLLSTTVRNSMADAIDDDLVAGSSARFQNAAQTQTYANCDLQTPAFGNAATGQITLQGTPTETSASSGTVARCGFYDAATGGNLLFTLGVASGGSPDMTISNTTLAAGDQVEISSLTITVPPGAVDAS